MRTMNWVAAMVLLVLTGCATAFTGSPYVENGRSGCEAKCRGDGMQLAGMVHMGEYSNACVCELPRGAAAMDRRELLNAAAVTAGGAAGVAMQTQRQAQQQHAH